MCGYCCGGMPVEKRGEGHKNCSIECYNAPGESGKSKARHDADIAAAKAAGAAEVIARALAVLDAEVTETIERKVRSARGDVRCIDCNLRYDERDQYGCHIEGHGHDYDDGDLSAAEENERSEPVDYVTLKVADLRAALTTGGEG